MVVKASSSVSVFFDEDEILEREAREEILFKDFPKRLKTIVGLSKGWDKILTGIEFSKIKSAYRGKKKFKKLLEDLEKERNKEKKEL